SLERRFIPAGKSAPSVRRFELRGGQPMLLARRVLVFAAVETTQLVVERSLKHETQRIRPLWDRAVKREPTSFRRLLQSDAGGSRVFFTRENRFGDFQLRSIENDFRRWLQHLDSNGHRSRKAAAGQVGFQAKIVASRNDMSG